MIRAILFSTIFFVCVIGNLCASTIAFAATNEVSEETSTETVKNTTAETDTVSDKKSDRKKKWKEKRPKVYGYIQVYFKQAFETGTNGLVDNNLFRVQRVRLGFEGKILPKVSYDIEFDPRAPEVLGLLRDAFIQFKGIPKHKLRVGQQKTRFGYENLVSSTRLFAVNRTELSDNFARGANLRDLGVGLFGYVPLNDNWRFEDDFTIVNGAGFNVQDDDTPMKNIWGRVGVRHDNPDNDNWVRIGASGGFGDLIEPEDPIDGDPEAKIDIRRIGVDLEFEVKWLMFNAEFVQTFDKETIAGVEEEADAIAWYANFVGKTPLPIGPIFRIDTEDDEYRRWLFGAYYGYAKDKFRVLLNYEFRELFDDTRGDDKLYLWMQARFGK